MEPFSSIVRSGLAFIAVSALTVVAGGATQGDGIDYKDFQVPPGFHVTIGPDATPQLESDETALRTIRDAGASAATFAAPGIPATVPGPEWGYDAKYWADLPGAVADINNLFGLDNALYVSCRFSADFEPVIDCVLRWDGVAWTQVGGMMNGPVSGLASLNGALVVGGHFTEVGGIPANGVTRWNGISWEDMGEGLETSVTKIAAVGDDLFAAAAEYGDSSITSTVHRWDGIRWNRLPGDFNGTISSIDGESSTSLFVGGRFNRVDSKIVNSIARWDGNAWNSVGTGQLDAVSSIAVRDSELFAAVQYYSINPGTGFPPFHYVAKWNGFDWSGTGSYPLFDDYISSLLIVGERPIAGGWFRMVEPGVVSRGISLYDGARWRPLADRGIEISVRQLASVGHGIFVAGVRPIPRTSDSEPDSWVPYQAVYRPRVNVSEGQLSATPGAGVFGADPFGYYQPALLTDSGTVATADVALPAPMLLDRAAEIAVQGKRVDNAFTVVLPEGTRFGGDGAQLRVEFSEEDVARFGAASWEDFRIARLTYPAGYPASKEAAVAAQVSQQIPVAFRMDGGRQVYAITAPFAQEFSPTEPTGTYAALPVQMIAASGWLRAEIQPAAALAAGAQWRVDGGEWLSVEAPPVGISPGFHTVEFSQVVGWAPPLPQQIEVVINEVAVATAQYSKDYVLTSGDFTPAFPTALQPGTPLTATWGISGPEPTPMWAELFLSKTGGFDMWRGGATLTGSSFFQFTGGTMMHSPAGQIANWIPDGVYTVVPMINRPGLGGPFEWNYANNWAPIAGKRLLVRNTQTPQCDVEWLGEPTFAVNGTSVTVTGVIRNNGPAASPPYGFWVEVIHGTFAREGYLRENDFIGPGAKISSSIDAGATVTVSLDGTAPLGSDLIAMVDSTDIVPETEERNNSKGYEPLPPTWTGTGDVAIVSAAIDPVQLAPASLAPLTTVRWTATITNKTSNAASFWVELFHSTTGGASLTRSGITLTSSEKVYLSANETKTFSFTQSLNSVPDGIYSMTAIADREGIHDSWVDLQPRDNAFALAGRVTLHNPTTPFWNGHFGTKPTVTRDGNDVTVTFSQSDAMGGWTEAFYGRLDESGRFVKTGQIGGGIRGYRESIWGSVPTGPWVVGVLTDSTDLIPETDETDNYSFTYMP